MSQQFAGLLARLPIVLDASTAAKLLPHRGAMCLLETVTACDFEAIQCTAISHALGGNPLREDKQLPIIAGVEYAAQAMAIHSALCAQHSDTVYSAPDIAYLATLKQVEWTRSRLDDVDGPLTVRATKIDAIDGASTYQFDIHAAQELLLHGTAMVARAS